MITLTRPDNTKQTIKVEPLAREVGYFAARVNGKYCAFFVESTRKVTVETGTVAEPATYVVDPVAMTCTCNDAKYRRRACKHCLAYSILAEGF